MSPDDAVEFYDTPRGSEVEQLQWYSNVAIWLYVGNCTGNVGQTRSNYWRQRLDAIPGAGEYYRALVQDHPLRDLVLMRHGAFLAGQAARELPEKPKKGKARHGS
jgi:hypothetical protein